MVEPATRPKRADFVRFLWRVLVAAVVVWVVTGIVTVFMDQTDRFQSNPAALDFLIDAGFIAFRVGAGALALMAGLWLSTRPWNEV